MVGKMVARAFGQMTTKTDGLPDDMNLLIGFGVEPFGLLVAGSLCLFIGVIVALVTQ